MKANASRMVCGFRETISDLLLEEYAKVRTGRVKLPDAVICNQVNGSSNIPAAAKE